MFVMKQLTIFIALALIVLTTSQSLTVQSDDSIAFETIVKDTESGISEESFFLITTRNDWKKLWKGVYSIFPVRPPFPEFDFSSQMIIAAFSGSEGAGVSISIESITRGDEQLRINVTQTIRTGPRCPPRDAAIHHPFHIVVLEKVAKPARKNAEFILETEQKDCDTSSSEQG